MKTYKSIYLIYVIDILIAFFCITGIYHIINKPALPLKITVNDSLIVTHESRSINEGELISSVDGHNLNSSEEIELALDERKIGDTVDIGYLRNGIPFSQKIILKAYYSSEDIFTYCFIGSLFFIMGIFLITKTYPNKQALVYHWASMATALVLMTTAGTYSNSVSPLGYVLRCVMHISYSFCTALFIHFTFIFPFERKNYKPVLKIVYTFALLFSLLLNIFFLLAVVYNNDQWIRIFILTYNIFRIYLVITIAFAIYQFFRSYRITTLVSEKKKLKWLLLGFIVGPLSYMIFWVIPFLINGKGFVPESIVIMFLAAVPITFTIAIVKYHFLDIDFILNRSVVYGIVITLLIMLYIGIFSTLHGIISEPFSGTVSPLIAAILLTLIFQPMKGYVQLYVDKKFFRVQYNFREALKLFLNELTEVVTIETLTDKIVKRIDELIHVNRIGFFLLNKNRSIKLTAHKNFDILVGRSLKINFEDLKTRLSHPVALKNKLESGITIEEGDFVMFKRWGICLIFPVKSADRGLLGFLVLGDKLSGSRFTIEDIDLLNAVISRTAAAIERINLQEDLLKEHLETERLEELNRLKSFFVSSVSHDLKTPLTSIKLFAELLKSKEGISEKNYAEYLEIIKGESDKLTGMINTILDFSKIEKGVKGYNFELIELNESIKEVIKSMQYQINMQGFELKVQLFDELPLVQGDRTAIEGAILNLLSNAVKYSIERKIIGVCSYHKDNYSVIEVKDEGIGISNDHLNKIFDPFFRENNPDVKAIGGAGLGLAIVKHVMDAHKGVVEVSSCPGKGSSFILKFPDTVQ